MRRTGTALLTRLLGILLMAGLGACEAADALETDAQGDASSATCLPANGLLDQSDVACLAEKAGLPHGITGYTVRKEKVAALGCTVWLVMTTTWWEPKPCHRGGEALVIDTETGEVLQHNEWAEKC